MDRSIEKADVFDNSRKSRPLDSLNLTPSARSRTTNGALTATLKSKVLKRKRNSSLENRAPLHFRKKSGKEVSLNSFAKGTGKGKLRVGVTGLKAYGLVSGAIKINQPSSSSVIGRNLRNVSDNSIVSPSGKDGTQISSGVNQCNSIGLNGGIIVTKRRRGVLLRKKIALPASSDREIVDASSTKSTTDHGSIRFPVSQSETRKPRRKHSDSKEDASMDNESHSCIGNGCNFVPGHATKRRRLNGRKRQDSNILGNKDHLLNALKVFPDEDEDSLEQNAARMLSSRFDPSYSGFSRNRVASPRPANEPSLAISQRSIKVGAEMSATGRVLRPRKHDGRGFARKRRHFYEVCSNNMDPYWVVKQRIRVFWPLDKCWYFGLVKDYDPVTKMHHVKYDDRDEEWINLQNERFKLLLFPSEVTCKFNHERPIKEGKNRDKKENKRSSKVDFSIGGLVETEPIISWLTRSTGRERRVLSASKGFKLNGIRTTVSNMSTSLLKGSTEDDKRENILRSENTKLPFVYFRRRARKDIGHLKNYDKKGLSGPISLLASAADTESALKELYITIFPQVLTNLSIRLKLPIWGRCRTVIGSASFLMCRSPCFHYNYKLIQLLPLVRMEVGLADNLSLKLYLLESCLSWAVGFLCRLLRENYWQKTSQTKSDDNVPFKELRIIILNFHMGHKYRLKVDGFISTGLVYLEKKLKEHCIMFKEFSTADYTFDQAKSLSIISGRALVRTYKDIRTEGGIESKGNLNCIHADESDQVSDITLDNFGSSNTVATDSKLSSFAHLRVETDAFSLSIDRDYLKSSNDCLSMEVNDGACSVRYSDCRKDSGNEMFAGYHKLPEHIRSYQGSENLFSSFPEDDPSSPDKSEGVCISTLKVLKGTRFGNRTLYMRKKRSHSPSNLLWEMNERVVHCSNRTESQSTWHRNRRSLVSPISGPRSALWSEDFIQSGFASTTKKPRTQVSYPAISRGHDIRLKNRIHHRKGSLYKKFRADLPKKVSVSLESHRSIQMSLTCDANVLITVEDRGWRELGAEVVLDSDDQKDWKLMVKVAGETKFSYKPHQVLQPGIPNRYTHAMMWKGGRDWSLEFTDRNQWLLFKMMHGQCFNQNIRSASVKNIPIPGVQLIDDGDDSIVKVPFVRNSSKYFQLIGTEVEMALDPSHVLYDMDSDDENWFSKLRDSMDSSFAEMTDDLFERVMDMFEKFSYVNQCDCLNDDEIAEFMVDFGSLDVIKAIHGLWHEKRKRKGMPLIRHYQPPLWECYQKQVKEWELAILKTLHPSNESQEKSPVLEKPPMFAFCLKPRGLEANKGSKQRSHKKLMYTAHHSSFSSREHDGFHSSGRRWIASSAGDEKVISSMPSFEGLHSTHWLQSPLSFSPRDSRTAVLMSNNAVDRPHYPKFFRNFSKKRATYFSPWDSSALPSPFIEKSTRNGVHRWASDSSEWLSTKQIKPDINEFRLRDASSAAQHASNMAKLKREKAQWLMHKADLALHKAVVAIMTADAIRTTQEELIGDE